MRHNRFLLVLLLMTAATVLLSAPSAVAQTMGSGWYWPTGSSNFCGYLGWQGYNSGWGYHLAQDMCNSSGSPVYSLGDGQVISSGEHNGYGCNGTCTGGCVLVRYQSCDGTWFTAMYGHLNNYVGTGGVSAGQVLGYTAGDWSPPHLHFSIHAGYDPEPNNPWRGYTTSTGTLYGFTDPIPFLNAHGRNNCCTGPSTPNLTSPGDGELLPRGTNPTLWATATGGTTPQSTYIWIDGVGNSGWIGGDCWQPGSMRR